MKIQEAKKYLSPKTFDDIDIDISVYIEHDEFNNHGQGDYRERGIDRLKKMKVPFHSTWNNLFNMVKRVVKIKCIYCGRNMEATGGGGNSQSFTTDFRCKCGARAGVTMDHDAIRINPPEE